MNKKNKICVLVFIALILVSFSFLLIKRPFKTEFKLIDNNDIKYEELKYEKITGGQEYRKSVKLKTDNVKGFEFFSEWRMIKEEFRLEVKVFDGSDILYENTFTRVGKDFPNLILLDKPIVNSKNKEVTISYKILNDDINLYLLMNDSDVLRIDQIVTKNSYWLLIFIFVALLSVFLAISFMGIKNEKEELKPIVKLFMVIGYLLTMLVFGFLLLLFLYKCIVINKVSIIYDIALIVLLLINCGLGVYLYKNLPKQLCYLFLVIAIPISVMYLVLFTPGMGQDGIRHYARAYGLSNGELFKKNIKTEIPLQVPYTKGLTLKDTFKELKEPANYKDTYNDTQALYNPILYVGSATGIGLIKLVNGNPYFGWYLAKIINMIIAITIGFFIIKKTPKKYQLLMMLYLLIPMNIYQYTTLSADTLINLSMLWLVVLCLNKYEDNSSLKLIDWIQIFITSYILVFSKDGYFLIPLALLFFIRNNIKNTKNYLYYLIGIVVLFIGINVGSNILYPSVVEELEFVTANVLTTGTKYAIQTPYKTIYAFGNYVINSPVQYLIDFVGYGFVWSSKIVPISLPIIYLILLVVSCFNDEKSKEIDNKTKIGFIISVLFTFVFIVVGMYALEHHSNMAIGEIWGVQGRYFYPVFILIFLIIANIKNIFNKDLSKYIIITSLLVHLMYLYKFVMFLL